MSDKAKGVLCYIFTIITGLIFLLSKDSSKNVKMHAAQAIVVWGLYVIVTFVYGLIPIVIPFFSTIVYVLYMVLLIMGIVKACKEEDPELPVVGGLTKKIFAKKIEE